jgi:hypothetical protein
MKILELWKERRQTRNHQSTYLKRVLPSFKPEMEQKGSQKKPYDVLTSAVNHMVGGVRRTFRRSAKKAHIIRPNPAVSPTVSERSDDNWASEQSPNPSDDFERLPVLDESNQTAWSSSDDADFPEIVKHNPKDQNAPGDPARKDQLHKCGIRRYVGNVKHNPKDQNAPVDPARKDHLHKCGIRRYVGNVKLQASRRANSVAEEMRNGIRYLYDDSEALYSLHRQNPNKTLRKEGSRVADVSSESSRGSDTSDRRLLPSQDDDYLAQIANNPPDAIQSASPGEEEPTMPALRIDRWIDRLRRGEPDALELDRRRPSFIAESPQVVEAPPQIPERNPNRQTYVRNPYEATAHFLIPMMDEEWAQNRRSHQTRPLPADEAFFMMRMCPEEKVADRESVITQPLPLDESSFESRTFPENEGRHLLSTIAEEATDQDEAQTSLLPTDEAVLMTRMFPEAETSGRESRMSFHFGDDDELTGEDERD